MAVAPYSKTAGFGPGFLSAVPVTGWNAAAPIDALTPITFALIESVTLDFSFKLKELYSQSVYPIAGGASTGKVTGKAKISSFSPSIMNSLFFGASAAGSGVTVVQYAPFSIPATPFSITPAAPAATVDLGVFYQTVGTGILQKQFARVASGPTTGQYTFTPGTGVYLFAAADTLTPVLISYEGAAAGSSSFNMGNQLSGMAPQFQLNFSGVYGGQVYLFNFPNCCSEKLAFATKVNDWVGVEFDFEVFTGADPGTLGTVYMVS
jgi:hypothetical protein